MKSNFIKLTFLLSTMLLVHHANAQSIEKSVVASSGGETTAGGYTYQWTVGEAIIGDASPTGYIITEGFHPVQQDNSVGIATVAEQIQDVKLYPNPIADILTLELQQEEIRSIQVKVMDVSGRVIGNPETIAADRQIKHQINFAGLPSGTYFVVLSSNAELVYSSKVVKQ